MACDFKCNISVSSTNMRKHTNCAQFVTKVQLLYFPRSKKQCATSSLRKDVKKKWGLLNYTWETGYLNLTNHVCSHFRAFWRDNGSVHDVFLNYDFVNHLAKLKYKKLFVIWSLHENTKKLGALVSVDWEVCNDALCLIGAEQLWCSWPF